MHTASIDKTIEILFIGDCLMQKMHDAFVCVWNMYIFVNIFLRAKCQKKIHLSKLLAVTSC